ncbi:BlaI/MecI/CopY family transcriptional regulator [Xylanibacillus composti]|uniref:BlaI family transcriptional regulator n=1 Tax=Xylanibacillus composti TaxID=1572762 RepID=A0A8J4H8Y8_9BACL|nr:BlaI/MecI/CopY family transcriptional regulator [Xylanibacillus composti]MDT9726864.1 BlaI/MecI/CopY family transcriptional regulator [Xylanibacillus composti]GIQ71364.1 BlaI family transcriptional regulator [Xylanibacillus composti]
MKSLGKLSETELEVMEAIWACATPVTVAQLLEAFSSKKWKTSTVSTILKRLMAKGFLSKSMNGKTNYYAPALSWDAYKKLETQSFLGRLYNGKAKNLIAALVDDAELSPEDMKELRAWFEQKEDRT